MFYAALSRRFTRVRVSAGLCDVQVIAVISVAFVMTSTVSLTLSTLPSLHGPDGRDNAHLSHVEAACVGWFTVEYGVRLWASPDRCRFVRGALNVIDLVAILPYCRSSYRRPVQPP